MNCVDPDRFAELPDEPELECCRGEGCTVRATRDWLWDGLCDECTETQAACAHCGVIHDRDALEACEGELVCGACGDAEHKAREAEDGAYTGPIHLAEGWGE